MRYIGEQTVKDISITLARTKPRQTKDTGDRTEYRFEERTDSRRTR